MPHRREDRRLLVLIERQALLNRPSAFALRQEICRRVPEIKGNIARIPKITETRTGWAIEPVDLTTQDLLLQQENTEIVRRTLSGIEVRRPEQWFNYVVPGVPTALYNLEGQAIHVLPPLVEEEVRAQTKENPVSCRSSRYGANPTTGKVTWIVSFLKPVRPFRLFNTSESS